MGAQQSSEERELFTACLKKDEAVLTKLLKKGVNPNHARGHDGWLALHAAAYRGWKPAVIQLLDAHAEVNALNDDQHTPLFVALVAHQNDVADVLIARGATVGASNDAGDLWRHVFAVSSENATGRPGLALRLVQSGLNVNLANGDGVPPLMEAIARGMDETAAVFMDAPGIQLNAQDRDGATALHYAAFRGNLPMGRALVQRGADVHARHADGATPAFFAVEQGHRDFLAFLVNVDPAVLHARNGSDWSLVHQAVAAGSTVCLEYVLARLKAGDDGHHSRRTQVDSRTDHGSTALLVAAGHGRSRMVRKLIEAGADVNAVTSTHVSALHKAAMGGYAKVVKVLLKHGAAVNVENTEGWTPLHVASHTNHESIAKLLIKHGADVHARDARNLTALDVSLRNDSHDVSHALLDHDASHDPTHSESAWEHAVRAGDHSRAAVLERAVSASQKSEASSDRGDADDDNASVSSNLSGSRASGRAVNPRSEEERRNLELLLAAREGDATQIEALVANGAAVDTTSRHGLTPLFLAVSHSHDDAAVALLRLGARLTHSPQERRAEARASGGATFLHRAIVRGEDARVELLLELYDDLMLTDRDGNTAAHVAARMNNVTYLSSLLMQPGVDASARNHLGQTPLHVAIHALDTFRYLVTRDAPTNIRDVHGRTPLSYLAEAHDYDKMVFLLTAGADPTLADNDGRTPLHYVALAAQPSTSALDVLGDPHDEPAVECASILVKYGADLDRPVATSGARAIVLAIRANHAPLVRFLVNAGADALSPAPDGGESALSVARRTNLALAAIIETATGTPPAADDLEHRSPEQIKAEAYDVMLTEWAEWKHRIVRLEADNARLSQEVRQLRKLLVTRVARVHDQLPADPNTDNAGNLKRSSSSRLPPSASLTSLNASAVSLDESIKSASRKKRVRKHRRVRRRRKIGQSHRSTRSTRSIVSSSGDSSL